VTPARSITMPTAMARRIPLAALSALALAAASPGVALAGGTPAPSAQAAGSVQAAGSAPAATTAPQPAAAASIASSGATTTTTPAPTTTAPPAAKPGPATGRLHLTLAGAFHLDRQTLTVTGRRVRVDGRIAPYVRGERVTVRVWLGHRLLKQTVVTPRPTHTKQTAVFGVRFSSPHAGLVHVVAIHARSAALRRVAAAAPALDVLSPHAGPGSRGTFVALVQQRLALLGYAVPRTGAYDNLTGLAVLAFRKVNGMARIATLSPTIVDRLLRGVGGFHVRYPSHGRHVEANLGQQVLALIDHGHVFRAYVTSSGKPSTPTVLGSFRFYSKTIGTNAKGMVDSNYFIRGYAIHGYFDVPTYAASHGCLRVPIPDAFAIFSWVRVGDGIDVYS
jgi:peptidoglycan hydrolase-like protein with peptidoglycan-binding domain